jgi:hypothetical protein
LKEKVVRQIVDLGDENEDHVIVNKGISEGEILLLSEPEKLDDIETIGWEIYNEQIRKLKENKENNNQPAISEKTDTLGSGLKGKKIQG